MPLLNSTYRVERQENEEGQKVYVFDKIADTHEEFLRELNCGNVDDGDYFVTDAMMRQLPWSNWDS